MNFFEHSTLLRSKLMYRIAVLDDDERWCLALQRFSRNELEIFVFSYAEPLVKNLLQQIEQYDLILVDFSLAPRHSLDEYINGRQLIQYLKKTLSRPPLLVLVTAFISKNDLETGRILCPEADGFIAKDAGIDDNLQQIKLLLKSKNP